MKTAIINLITRTSLNRKTPSEIHSNKDAMIVKFVSEINTQGWELDLYISDAYKPIKDENLGIKICYLPTLFQKIFWPARLPFTPSLFWELKNNYDSVICSEAFQWSTIISVLAKLFSFKKKMKIVVWQEMAKHQKIFKRYPSLFFYKIILKYFLDYFISCYVPRSERARIFLMKQGIKAKKITPVISHGYDQDIFFTNSQVRKERYIFSPSRLVFSKGIDVLLKAFALVCQKIDDLDLIIQGEGPLHRECVELSRNLGVYEKVKFDIQRLNHNEMRERYQKAVITVISSRSDNVIFSDMESIACGTPVILSTGADSHANYCDGKGGTFFKSEDYKQLADIMIAMLKSPLEQKRLENEAIDKSCRYRNSYIANQFLDIIQKVT